MAIVSHLRDLLDKEGIKYQVITHSRAYTAQEIAASLHVPGRNIAKTVIVRAGDKLAMAVIPGHHMVDVNRLSRTVGADARLASEEEFEQKFPGCEVGAMPPFGSLYGLEVYVSRPLLDDEEIVFNCGTHTDAVKMRFADFERLAKPHIGDFSVRAVARPRRDPFYEE